MPTVAPPPVEGPAVGGGQPRRLHKHTEMDDGLGVFHVGAGSGDDGGGFVDTGVVLGSAAFGGSVMGGAFWATGGMSEASRLVEPLIPEGLGDTSLYEPLAADIVNAESIQDGIIIENDLEVLADAEGFVEAGLEVATEILEALEVLVIL